MLNAAQVKGTGTTKANTKAKQGANKSRNNPETTAKRNANQN